MILLNLCHLFRGINVILYNYHSCHFGLEVNILLLILFYFIVNIISFKYFILENIKEELSFGDR